MPTSITSSGITFDDATTLTTGVVPTANIANAAVTPVKLSQPFTLATSVASTSGTAIDFTGIPSWARRITVMFSGVSTNGTSDIIVRIGAGSVDTSGYSSSFGYLGASPFVANITSGFGVSQVDANQISFGHIVIMTAGSNVWTYSSVIGRSSSAFVLLGGGARTLGGTLDRVRITTVNGSDTFDAGTINISYEG